MSRRRDIEQSIYKGYEKQAHAEKERPHLGASGIGHSCTRHIWYSFRMYAKQSFDGRMYRLFERGHREEGWLVSDLRKFAGFIVEDHNKATLKQWTLTDKTGHFGGSMDAIAIEQAAGEDDLWYLLEFKTHSEKNFNKLDKEGSSIEFVNPKHYLQMQSYMGLSGLKKAIYIAVCKNTDRLYIEEIEYDKDAFHRINIKVGAVLTSQVPPPRVRDNPLWFECKMCNFKDICYNSAPIRKNCRTCPSAIPIKEGKWWCKHHKEILLWEKQLKGCDDWQAIDDFR